MPSRWAGRWSTPSSPKCRRTPGSIFPGIPGSPSSRRSARAKLEEFFTRGGGSRMLDQLQFDTELTVHAESSEYDRLRDMLDNQVSGFADEHKLSFDTLSLLLIDCGVTNALTRYLLSVDKPSAPGSSSSSIGFGARSRISSACTRATPTTSCASPRNGSRSGAPKRRARSAPGRVGAQPPRRHSAPTRFEAIAWGTRWSGIQRGGGAKRALRRFTKCRNECQPRQHRV